MSNTRYSDSPDDFSPEHALASASLSGINIPLTVVARVAGARGPVAGRPMIWLHNYALMRRLSADSLSESLGLDRSEIRASLTDPYAPASTIERFGAAVGKLRDSHDRSRRRLARTRASKMIHKVVKSALASRTPCEVIGRWRAGKSWSAWEAYQDDMDRAAWFRCPSDDTDRSFIFSLARSLGIGVGSGCKPGQLRPKILSCFGSGAIELLIIDEAHYLWPSTVSRSGHLPKPKRLEFVRELYDLFIPSQVGIVLLTTPQHADLMSRAISGHETWAPGQWDGRVLRFSLPDSMSDDELADVARWHGPDLAESALPLLVEFAKASEGYMGKMVRAIELARSFFGSENGISRDAVGGAIRHMSTP
jgi:hypothetical protein